MTIINKSLYHFGYVLIIFLLASCGHDDNDYSSCGTPPPDLQVGGGYFEVYSTGCGQLLGTSEGGLTFNTQGYDSFVIYVPSSSDQIFFDAIQLLDTDFGGDLYVASSPEDTHNYNGMFPYSTEASCDWYSPCAGFTSQEYGEGYIESEPDNYAISNTVGSPSFYGFSALYGASSMTIILTNAPIDSGSQ